MKVIMALQKSALGITEDCEMRTDDFLGLYVSDINRWKSVQIVFIKKLLVQNLLLAHSDF